MRRVIILVSAIIPFVLLTPVEANTENNASIEREADNKGPDIELITSVNTDEWTNEEIECSLTCRDNQSGLEYIEIKDGDEVLKEIRFDENSFEEEADCVFTLGKESINDEGSTYSIKVVDMEGNISGYLGKYYIDRKLPQIEINGVTNQAIYSGNPGFSISINDNSSSPCELNYQATRLVRGELSVVEEFNRNSEDSDAELSGDYDEEGTYRIFAYATDAAGNISETVDIAFIVDSTEPEIGIDGISENGVYKNPVAAEIEITEENYEGCAFVIQLIKGESGGSHICEQFEANADDYISKKQITVDEDGDYILKIVASDASGNISEKSVDFRIDREAPAIAFQGASDNMISSKSPQIVFSVEDKCYEGTRVIATLLKSNENNEFVTLFSPEYTMESAKCDYYIPLLKEGRYRLLISATDTAGNRSDSGISFTIDYTPPVISRFRDYDNEYVKRFSLPDDFEKGISDLTDVKLKAFLNTEDFDISNAVAKEGKYVLRLEASDEAGNTSTEAVTFIVDNTKPSLVMEGLKADGTAGIGERVELSLYDEDDSFLSITLNGQELVLNSEANRAAFALMDYGDYELNVEAKDAAGNCLRQIVEMKCAMSPAEKEEYRVITAQSMDKPQEEEIKIIERESSLSMGDEQILAEPNEKNPVKGILGGIVTAMSALGFSFYKINQDIH